MTQMTPYSKKYNRVELLKEEHHSQQPHTAQSNHP